MLNCCVEVIEVGGGGNCGGGVEFVEVGVDMDEAGGW